MGRPRATDAAPAQLLQLKFQELAWGPWAGIVFPSPIFSAIKRQGGGAWGRPCFGEGQDPGPAFWLIGRKSAAWGPCVWGLCAWGLESSSNCLFLWGLVGNLPKSRSKEEKQTVESRQPQLWDIFQD